jgi:hypothetical protein
MIVIVRPEVADLAMRTMPEIRVIGEVIPGTGVTLQ